MNTDNGRSLSQPLHAFHPLRVQALRPDGEDASVVTFDVPSHLANVFAFQPGQHLTLRVGEQRRSYSICSGPGQALQVGVRRVPQGQVSNWLHQHLRVGSTVDVMPPSGSFGARLQTLLAQPSTQPTQQSRHHVLLVAGGSGITPLFAMAQALLQRTATCRVTLVYANRTLASTMFKEALEDLKNRHLQHLSLHLVFSRETVGEGLHQGRLDADRMASLLQLTGPVDDAFVCGPHDLNATVQTALLRAGLASQCIHTERFGVPVPPNAAPVAGAGGETWAKVNGQTDGQADGQADGATNGAANGLTDNTLDAPTATVGILRDGLRRDVVYRASDGNLLAAATRAGLDLPFSCKTGVCATCRCRVLQGQVVMIKNFALQADDLARGFVLGCQAQPTTPQVVVSFDDR